MKDLDRCWYLGILVQKYYHVKGKIVESFATHQRSLKFLISRLMLVSICFNKSNVYIFSSNQYKIEFNTLKWWIVNNTRCFIKHWMKNFTASFSIKGKSEDLQKSVPFMQQNWHKGFIFSVAKKSSYNKDFSP